jgi:hypothetical protein
MFVMVGNVSVLRGENRNQKVKILTNKAKIIYKLMW